MSGRNDQSGVGWQQQEELRRLSALHQAGKITDEQYARKRKRIVSKAAALTATSRGSDGIASTQAIRVERSMNPLIIKGAIAVVVLAVLAQVGWMVYGRVMSYEATLPEDEPVVALAPETPEPTVAAPAAITSAPKPSAPAVAEPTAVEPPPTVEPTDVAADDTAEPVSVSPYAPVEVVMQPVPDPNAAPEPVAAAPLLDPSKQPVEWDVRFVDEELAESHPFNTWCDSIKKIESGRISATIGVKAGPVADGFDDPVYISFRNELYDDFRDRIGQAAPSLEFNALPGAVRTGRAMGERMTGSDPGSRNIAVLVTTVEDGRAYAYFYAGSNVLLRTFYDETVGRARLAAPEVAEAPAEAAPDDQPDIMQP